LQDIATFAIDHDLLVIADEAYEHLWFDDNVHIPDRQPAGDGGAHVDSGFGREVLLLHRLEGRWASGPADLIGPVRVIRQHLSYVSGGPFQEAMAVGLRLPDSYFDGFRADLAAKRDRLCAGLEELGLRVIPPQGTYFATTDVRPLGFADGDEFCHRVPHEAGVVAIPLSALSDHPEASAPTYGGRSASATRCSTRVCGGCEGGWAESPAHRTG
jgi:N-succinyldiaminopimelate aminotransferase